MKDPQRFSETITAKAHLFNFYRLMVDNTIAASAERFIQIKKNLIAWFIFTLGFVFLISVIRNRTMISFNRDHIIPVPSMRNPPRRSVTIKEGNANNITYRAILINA